MNNNFRGSEQIQMLLPLLLTASARRRGGFSRLNTQPSCTPVDASTAALRSAPHDSEPAWLAGPLL